MESLWLNNNQFVGRIPLEVGNCSMLKYIRLSNNKLSCPIPRELCDSESLVEINLDGNMLSGTVEDVFDRGLPQSLDNLSYLTTMDFHLNKFTREIPPDLGNLMQLEYVDFLMNMLDNRLEGEVLRNCICQNLSIISLTENIDLFLTFSKLALIGTVVGSVLVIAIIVFVLWWIQRSNWQRDLGAIEGSTNKFYEKNVIRGGGFGIVFKVCKESLLIYEYMVKRNLDNWLRNRIASLDWGKHIKASNILLNEDFDAKVLDFGLVRLISDCKSHISTDVASAISYIPPEYGRPRKANERGDIYRFGVVLLELVIRKQPTGPKFEDKDVGT
ncbi:Leucine-rich repeat receptor protein kinase EMS1 [Citrus sinensis]|uniref:Leucine-rich repeat receptor protein kinase EMS1 n=1 Tax=Citrus sinensis TaxID=2711 RepID=A0ACB8JEC0_CITSI|nr:Leucine-rich repeat receptor protein kinase EMS1 [Citrus sinensis]